mgnify:CR=1 FL=1
MNGIETIHLLWNLLAVWLPGAAVGAMIVCTVLLIRRDRYCRKLALAESPEAAEIRALAASGAVTPEEAGKLLAGCNALPAVRETSPLPDLPLKLVSAFGRIYSTMKIVMLAGVFAAFRAVHLAASAPGFRGEYEYRAENLPLLLGVSGAVLILAVLEFIASVRLLHGSFAARNYLIFNWILNFLLIRCEAGELDPETGQWWTKFIDASAEERQQMIDEQMRLAPRTSSGRKRAKRSRRRHKTDAGPAISLQTAENIHS